MTNSKRLAFENRPKWATPLSPAQWSALCDCQLGHPSLRKLKADLEWQASNNFPCPHCKSAAVTLGLIKPSSPVA